MNDGTVFQEASSTRERRRTRSLPEGQVQHSPTTKVKTGVSKPSPEHTQPTLTGRQSKVGGSKVGCRKEPIKPSPVKKSRQSVTSQSDFKNIGNAKCVVDPPGLAPRKRRLRSFERHCNSISSMQEDGAKSSPAKKLRRSTDKKSASSLPLETGESPVSKGKDAARHRQEKGMKSTRTLIKAASEDKEQKVGTVGKISGKRKLASISKAPKDETARTQGIETVKSTPEGLYDFVVDSPIPDDNNSDSVKGGTNSKLLSKSSKSSTSVGSKRSKVAGKKTRLRKEIDLSLITPKTRRCRVVLRPLNENKASSKKIKVKVDIHSGIPVQPGSSQKNKSDGRGKAKPKAQKVNKGKTRKVRPDSSSSSDLPIPKMPSTSFLDTEIFSEPYNDDSAIFLSPTAIKRRKPKADSKLQTPLSGMLTDKRISGVDCSFNVNNIKSTSTPNPEPKKDIDIGIDLVREQVLSHEPKLSQPEFSPVKQVETPADSDYGSMESFVTPSPLKDGERGHALSPAFSLEEDTGEHKAHG